MKNYLYMAVSADKFELPIAVEKSGRDLARTLGISYNTLISAMWRKSVSKQNYKCIKVEV